MKKRILSILLVSMITFLFTACAEGGTGTSQGRNENDETDVANSVSKAVGDQRREGTDSHILVAYFSMAGEQYVVGNIEKGFLTEYDLSGKTVIPFCTHEGSGIGGIQRTVEELLPGAEIIEGFGIQGETAQNSQDEAQQEVTQWLDDNGFLS